MKSRSVSRSFTSTPFSKNDRAANPRPRFVEGGKAVAATDTKGGERSVLLAMLFYVDFDSGLMWASLSSLGNICGLDVRTVRRHVRALEAKSILVIVPWSAAEQPFDTGSTSKDLGVASHQLCRRFLRRIRRLLSKRTDCLHPSVRLPHPLGQPVLTPGQIARQSSRDLPFHRPMDRTIYHRSLQTTTFGSHALERFPSYAVPQNRHPPRVERSIVGLRGNDPHPS
jgi:hypothetical protein